VRAIRYEVEDRVATITIDRPEKRNAMTYAVLAEFHEAVARAGADDEVHAVVLTGAGGAFCAGTDLSDLAATPEDARSTGGRSGGGRRPEAWPLVACPKPVVAAVDGPAVGMGAEFATQCDVRIASDRARFGWNFVRRGLVPDTGAGSFLLPRLIGPSAALRVLLSGELIDAAEARRLGFVHAVVPADELAAAADAEARRYLAASPFAVRRVKALVYAGLARPVDEHLRETATLLEECFRSEDHREGVAAFLERRDAHFTGR
jgi:2-(1,2-epoxy-1,2-dihydrophenyl)acetyl-CoA isomerase